MKHKYSVMGLVAQDAWSVPATTGPDLAPGSRALAQRVSGSSFHPASLQPTPPLQLRDSLDLREAFLERKVLCVLGVGVSSELLLPVGLQGSRPYRKTDR